MSYRRSDAGGYAGWVSRELVTRLAGDEVFRDVDSLHGGERWPERLEATLARCDVVLALIGPGWLTAAGDTGRRLDDPNDRVRLELEAGIRRGIPIVPALIGGARMPSADELPESLASLHEWQAVRLSDESWEHDIERLVADIKRARDAVPGELQLSARFAGHLIEEVIGRGGMGIVYRAHHLSLNRVDAIKVITPALAREGAFRDRFVRESQLAASIKHPNVVTVYDAGEENGLLYLTMEFIRGTDLRSLLAHGGRLSVQAAAEILVPVTGALQAAHDRGLVHRDVKPGNILIEERDEHRRVYLGDFGLARQKTSSSGLTSSGQWLGTADYVSPEQVMGETVDSRADIYSLGCVMFEMLSGQVPFPGSSETAKLVAHATKDPPRLLDLRPDLPPVFGQIVDKAMARDPDHRFRSAAELGAAVEGALKDEPAVVSHAPRIGSPERQSEPQLPLPERSRTAEHQPGGHEAPADSEAAPGHLGTPSRISPAPEVGPGVPPGGGRRTGKRSTRPTKALSWLAHTRTGQACAAALIVAVIAVVVGVTLSGSTAIDAAGRTFSGQAGHTRKIGDVRVAHNSRLVFTFNECLGNVNSPFKIWSNGGARAADRLNYAESPDAQGSSDSFTVQARTYHNVTVWGACNWAFRIVPG